MKKTNKFLVVAICFLCVITGFIFVFENSYSCALDVSVKNEGNTVGAITAATPLEQTFVAENNGLSRVEVLLATYGRVNQSNVTLEIIADDGSSVCSSTLAAASIADNSYYPIEFEPIADSKGHTYTIKVLSDTNDPNNAITAWASHNDNYPSGALLRDGADAGFDVAFNALYKSYSLLAFSIVMMILSGAIIALYNYFLCKKFNKNSFAVKITCFAISSVTLAFALVPQYNMVILDAYNIEDVFSPSGLVRTELFILPCLVIISFAYFEVKLICDFMVKKRWILAGAVFLLFFLNNLNFSNVSMWNEYVQPDIRPEFSDPIFGVKRSIRSDEWLVGLTRLATGELVGYGDVNNIIRGTYNSGLAASGLYLSYSALSNPLNWGYYLFGFEYGTSFYWSSIFILSFMLSFELSYIISRKNRLIALFGGCAIGLSQFVLWWSVTVVYVFALGLIVCIYHFVTASSKIQKTMLAAGTAFSFTSFVTNLYPAWQVPIAYLIIVFVACIVIYKWQEIKSFHKFEWLTIAIAFAFSVSVILSYLYDNRFYTENVMNTVYPGHRVSNGGGVLDKLFLYPQSLLYPFRDIGNPSEAGVFYSLFPVPLIWGALILIKQVIYSIKNQKAEIDWLNALLVVYSSFLIVYCTVGIPEWLSKITLMQYSTSLRAIDVIGLISILLLIRNGGNKDFRKMPVTISVLMSSVFTVMAIYCSNKQFPDYLSVGWIAVLSIVTFLFMLAVTSSKFLKIRKNTFLCFSAIIAVSGISVLPITKGTGALKDKPASFAIQEIVEADPDKKWAATNWIISNFVIANGGACITSTNYIPNMELWQKLDPNSTYNDIYNRYAHVTMVPTAEETRFELLQSDALILYLNYSDIKKCDISYIFSDVDLKEDSNEVDFNLIYNESNAYIYEVVYI